MVNQNQPKDGSGKGTIASHQLMAEELPELPQPLCDAYLRTAYFGAKLARERLIKINRRGIAAGRPDFSKDLWLSFVLELIGVELLNHWAVTGVKEYLPHDLPTYREALLNICDRLHANPQEFLSSEMPKLTRRVLDVAIDNFHWLESDLLPAEIVIRPGDDDTLIEIVAELLWKNRREPFTEHDILNHQNRN